MNRAVFQCFKFGSIPEKGIFIVSKLILGPSTVEARNRAEKARHKPGIGPAQTFRPGPGPPGLTGLLHRAPGPRKSHLYFIAFLMCEYS